LLIRFGFIVIYFYFFSVPIIPEFLYSIRHQHDHFTTPRIRITTTTTTTPQTPFGFNETNYGDPAAPFDFIGNTWPVKLNQKYQFSKNLKMKKISSKIRKWAFFSYFPCIFTLFKVFFMANDTFPS
jgi:hypothetical protein